MSKMRVSKADREYAKKLVKRFNEKATYHAKQGRATPQKISSKELLSGSRSDYNRMVASYERYMERGAEKEVEIAQGSVTSWEIDEYKRAQRSVNIRRSYARRKEDLDIDNPYTQSQMKKNGLLRLDSDPMKKRAGKEFQYKLDSLNRQRMSNYYDDKKQNYKETYLQTVDELYGANNELSNYLRDKPADMFYSALVSNDPILSIQFVSDETISNELKLQALSNWMEFYDDGFYEILSHDVK